MFHRVVATVLFVRDLAKCVAFYRDTLGLEMQESDANSAAFKLENVYFLLLEVSAAADLIGEEAGALKPEGGPRGLLAAEVKDVDAAYETLKARGVTLLRPPTTSRGGCARRTLPTPKATSGRFTSPSNSPPKRAIGPLPRKVVWLCYNAARRPSWRALCCAAPPVTTFAGNYWRI